MKKTSSQSELENIHEDVTATLQHACGDLFPEGHGIPIVLETPPDATLGDLAMPCFALSKIAKKSPIDIAIALSKAISPNGVIDRAVATGPYVNIFLSAQTAAKKIIPRVTPTVGLKGDSMKKKKILIEYVSPNTNKPLHLGHVRNALLGDSLARLCEAQGAKTIKIALINDRGIHICKSMVGYMIASEETGKQPNPRSAKMKSDHFVGEYYVLFDKRLKENETLMARAQECLQKWEDGDKATRALWKRMNTWALRGMKETCKKLGISFETLFFESALYTHGRDIIQDGLSRGIFKKDETGAVFADLSPFNLANKILLRRDGTSLYVTQDIYLALQKWKKYAPDQSLYVVASEQNFYFKQLFAIISQLGYSWADTLHHLSYGMVYLPEGKMKSREGTVVDADDIISELETEVTVEILKRDQHITQRDLKKRATIIALAALRYYMLEVTPTADMTFNPKESISLQGRTGPYILYTYARLKSILRKTRVSSDPTIYTNYVWEKEKQLILRMGSFPSIVSAAAAQSAPSVLAQYLFTLAQEINDYYHTTPVLNAESPTERIARLHLIRALAHTLKNGLGLLGIQTVEKM